MFRKQMGFFLLFLLPLLGLWVYQVAILRPSDLNHFKETLHQKQIASSQNRPASDQHRSRVQKDIWFTQDEDVRLHYKIASDASLLTLTPIGNQFEIVEKLTGIRCWMQDKLYEEDQQARLIEAEEGLYRYSTQEFTANGVALSLFHLPGHELPKTDIDKENAFLQGKAKDISFFFGGKTPQFQAKQFQATVVKE